MGLYERAYVRRTVKRTRRGVTHIEIDRGVSGIWHHLVFWPVFVLLLIALWSFATMDTIGWKDALDYTRRAVVVNVVCPFHLPTETMYWLMRADAEAGGPWARSACLLYEQGW
jgi:hypothetical protein